MASLNKAMLIGHLGQNPETRYMPNGDAVTTISIATTETWKDKSGQKQEETTWHRVTLFRKLGEIAAEYLKKGALVYIDGRIKTEEWTDKQGIKRYSTSIIAETMKMLGGKQSLAIESPRQTSAPANESAPITFDDDIPF